MTTFPTSQKKAKTPISHLPHALPAFKESNEWNSHKTLNPDTREILTKPRTKKTQKWIKMEKYQHCRSQPWGRGRRWGCICGQRGEEQSSAGTSRRSQPPERSGRPSRGRRHSCRCCSWRRPCTWWRGGSGSGSGSGRRRRRLVGWLLPLRLGRCGFLRVLPVLF